MRRLFFACDAGSAAPFQIQIKRRHLFPPPRARDPCAAPSERSQAIEFARVHLGEAAEPAVDVEALRLVPALQIEPRPRLRSSSARAVFNEAVLPALVLMLVELCGGEG